MAQPALRALKVKRAQLAPLVQLVPPAPLEQLVPDLLALQARQVVLALTEQRVQRAPRASTAPREQPVLLVRAALQGQLGQEGWLV